MRGAPQEDLLVCVRASGLEPEKYVLQHSDYVMMDEYTIEADLSTFDKSRLIKDLRRGSNIEYSPLDRTRYERIIDATGVSRIFLPVIKDDIILPCVQWRIRTDARLENRIRLGGIGFAWCFPLSGNEYHIGCGASFQIRIRSWKNWAGFGTTPLEERECHLCMRWPDTSDSPPIRATLCGRSRGE